MNKPPNIGLITTLLSCCCIWGCATTPQISYQRDVQPILVDKCVACHTPPYGKGYRKTGLILENYASLMEGSLYGPVIVPGDSEKSPLNMLVEGRAGNLARELELRHDPMTENEIRILRIWVEQGARNN